MASGLCPANTGERERLGRANRRSCRIQSGCGGQPPNPPAGRVTTALGANRVQCS